MATFVICRTAAPVRVAAVLFTRMVPKQVSTVCACGKRFFPTGLRAARALGSSAQNQPHGEHHDSQYGVEPVIGGIDRDEVGS